MASGSIRRERITRSRQCGVSTSFASEACRSAASGWWASPTRGCRGRRRSRGCGGPRPAVRTRRRGAPPDDPFDRRDVAGLAEQAVVVAGQVVDPHAARGRRAPVGLEGLHGAHRDDVEVARCRLPPADEPSVAGEDLQALGERLRIHVQHRGGFRGRLRGDLGLAPALPQHVEQEALHRFGGCPHRDVAARPGRVEEHDPGAVAALREQAGDLPGEGTAERPAADHVDRGDVRAEPLDVAPGEVLDRFDGSAVRRRPRGRLQPETPVVGEPVDQRLVGQQTAAHGVGEQEHPAGGGREAQFDGA